MKIFTQEYGLACIFTVIGIGMGVIFTSPQGKAEMNQAELYTTLGLLVVGFGSLMFGEKR